MGHGRLARAADNFFHGGLEVLCAVLPAQRVAANEILESDTRHIEQAVGELEETAELGVGGDQVQLGVEDTESTGEVLQHAAQHLAVRGELRLAARKALVAGMQGGFACLQGLRHRVEDQRQATELIVGSIL